MLALRAGPWTSRSWALAGLALVVGAGAAWSQPRDSWALIGSIEPGGRVAIVRGAPQPLADRVRSGARDEQAEPRVPQVVRAVTTPEAATVRLEAGDVQAALLPAEAAPPGAPVLWERSLLPPSIARLASFLSVLAFFVLLLAPGSRLSAQHPMAIFAELYVDALRGIPMLVVILYVGFPLQGAVRELSGGLIDMSRMTRGVVALALGYAAYMAEIFRAGIQAVPLGQREAARSLGLTPWQTARFVVLPQALRIVVPPLGNEFIAMFKDTSLLSILSIRDITQRAREFQASTFMTFPPYNTVALLYIALTLAASSFVKWLERRAAWPR